MTTHIKHLDELHLEDPYGHPVEFHESLVEAVEDYIAAAEANELEQYIYVDDVEQQALWLPPDLEMEVVSYYCRDGWKNKNLNERI